MKGFPTSHPEKLGLLSLRPLARWKIRKAIGKDRLCPIFLDPLAAAQSSAGKLGWSFEVPFAANMGTPYFHLRYVFL